jgi:hypothetical protein
MGLKSGRDLDNIQELPSQIEGEDERLFLSMPISCRMQKTHYLYFTNRLENGGMICSLAASLFACAGRFYRHSSGSVQTHGYSKIRCPLNKPYQA